MRNPILLLGLIVCLGNSTLAQDDPWAAREAPDIENPKTARDYYSRGWKYQKAGQYDEALADYRVAGELDPMFFDAHFFQSSLLAERRDYRGAIAAWTASLKARPKSFIALFNRGLYHEYLREIDDAIADYTQAAAEDANFSYMGGAPEENRARAYHYRGRAYQWFKKDDVSAVADFTAALELDPEILRVRRRRALAYHNLGEYAKAFEDLKRDLEQDPSDSTASGRLSRWGWELVESLEPQYRDGELALLLAQKTKTDRNSLQPFSNDFRPTLAVTAMISSPLDWA